MNEAKQFCEDIIKNLRATRETVTWKMKALTKEDPEWDVWYQIQKDLGKYITDQEHTIGLIEDGQV